MTLRANFFVFTVIDVKVSFMDINHVGNVVYQKHMHAALYWVIRVDNGILSQGVKIH